MILQSVHLPGVWPVELLQEWHISQEQLLNKRWQLVQKIPRVNKMLNCTNNILFELWVIESDRIINIGHMGP